MTDRPAAENATRTYRPRRARILRGPVSVSFARDLPTPSWHLDPACAGLEKVTAERRDERTFPDTWTLAEDTEGRLCRMCTLESVLRTLLRDIPKRAAPTTPELVYITFSANPPHSRTTPTMSSQDRMRRLRRALKLTTIDVPGTGIVTHGHFPARLAPIIARNLTTHILPWVRRTPTDEHVHCFWILSNDLNDQSERAATRRLWTTARRLTS